MRRILDLFLRRPKVDYSGVGRNDDCPCGSGRKFKQCCIHRVERRLRAQRDAKLFGGKK